MGCELAISGDRRIKQHTDVDLASTSVEQWQGISRLSNPDAGMVAAQDSVNQHFGSVQIFEAPAGQAVEAMPQVSRTLLTGAYDSCVKLNVQITNVPEVSQPVNPQKLIHHLDAMLAAGATAVRPVERWLATPNAVNTAFISVGPALDNAVNYYANTPGDQVVKDAQFTVNSAGEALETTIGHALTPEERAKVTGSIMPLFFFEGNVREPIQPEAVRQLSLDGLKESELSELGILQITRKAGKGGDWPVINERPSPDVVQQEARYGCVAAVGEML